jgi:hypothetical protein
MAKAPTQPERVSRLEELRADVARLTATRDGLRARLAADPDSAYRWTLQRDLAATERALAFAETKLGNDATTIRR